MEVRPEYPRPQWQRRRWQSLNGEWDFEIDHGDTGLQRGLRSTPYSRRIVVPFAPESELSGIGNTDFMDAVWYRREISVDPSWTGERILLHFQAVDHDTTVWVNDVEVGRHRGGSTSFAFDITEALDGGTATVVVRARDPRTGVQARGKQATWYENTGCYYTRTTGIWQTVWLEPVGRSYLQRPRITPDVANSRFIVTVPIDAPRRGHRLTVELTDSGGVVSSEEVAIGTDFVATCVLPVPSDRRRLWSPADPHLYGLRFVLDDGEVLDEVESYAGLRSIAIEGNRFLLNGEPVFQRLVLDQGYWPDGIMTAPTDDALVRDIQLALDAGFNGARLHQKVFEERYLYHADRLGYLVWGEFPDWGAAGQGPRGNNQQPTTAYVAEWQEVLARDFNHPSIIGWCPLNETHQDLHDRETQLDDVTRAMFRAAKAADPTRPVIDASGYSHRVPETDVWDSHSYEQDPAAFALEQAGLANGEPFGNVSRQGAPQSLPYRGQPYMVSEYGGIWWNAAAASASGADRRESWGYGQRVGSLQEFYERFEGLTRVLLEDPAMFGYCYTQLTDVFQEQNGIYGFDRSEKFDVARIRAVQTQQAAYEREEVRV
ncbi:sugar-binding domain-containing protein [Kribbella sp. NPDC000426]|uniref:glycoside hydrolase family 2 protein n=1 Tax=Kribbella sp. NPDC000426 TaxID=3154255 RepID=UPI00332A078F